MNKMFKKVSAVALAAAMTLGSSVAAQAATVKSILESGIRIAPAILILELQILQHLEENLCLQ